MREYGARLGDAAYWAPYVAAALARHGLPVEAPVSGAVGTYPTFLAGRYVVKLFGARFAGGEGYCVECTLHTLFLGHPKIPAPALVADGTLFDGPLHDGVPWSDRSPDAGIEMEATWPWPYLITTRLDGVAWRNAALDDEARAAVAREVGEVVRRVHALPVPAGPYWTRDWLDEARAGCLERHWRWRSLPPPLIEQIESYLAAAAPAGGRRCLVHADLHADHLFVSAPAAAAGGRARRGCLDGVIDWGDAFATDPYYELPALHLGTFMGDKRLLRAFLEGYGWAVGPDFARRAMAMALLHEFDVFDDVRARIERHAPRDLDEAAAALWAVA